MTSLNRLLRWAGISRPGKDTGQFPIQQVAYLGKVSDCLMVFPYGMHANVDGGSLTLLFAVGGDDDNKAGIATSGNRRQTLQPGEVMVYSPKTGASVVFKASGDIDVTTGAGVNITAAAAVTVTAASAEVTAATATVNAVTTINGDTTVNGNLVVSGVATAGALASTGTGGSSSVAGTMVVTGDVTINGKAVDGHVHTDPQGGSTGPF